MAAPESIVAEVKPAGGFSAIRPRGVPVFLFTASRGPTTPQSFGARQHTSIVSTYGAGGVRKGAYVASRTNSPCVTIRVPATSRAASATTPVVTKNGSSTFTSTLSGTASDGADVVIAFPTGGTTGTAGAAYKVSTDGGGTFGASTPLNTATSITVRGVSVALGSAKVITAGDTIAWFQRAASGAILTQTTTRAASSTATYVASGTPVDAYRVRFEWLKGGTQGTPGATYRYALDWDGITGTFTPETALGANTSVTLYDGSEDSGIAIAVGTGTIDANDYLSFNTTAPEPQWSDISAALDALRASNFVWSFLVVCAPLSAADAASLDSKLMGWASGSRRAWALCETRDRETDETLAAWRTRLLADFISFTSTRAFPAAGHAPAADPITGRRDRRSCLIDYAERLIAVSKISTDPGMLSLGPLPPSRVLHVNGVQVEHDARTDSALFDRGFLTLRTWEDEQYPGTYPTGGVCMGGAGDFQLLAIRRVHDAFDDALQSQARAELLRTFDRWTAPQLRRAKGSFKVGDIYEAQARGIQGRLQRAAEEAIVATGDASGVRIILDRTPVKLGGGKLGLKWSGKFNALGYLYNMTGETGLADPNYEA